MSALSSQKIGQTHIQERALAILLPVLNLAAALLLSALILLWLGKDPIAALALLADGAFGSPTAIGFTLYYATSLTFTGLAVAIAFHGGLFNIGADGQAYIGGLGVGLMCLALDGWPWWAAEPVTLLMGAAFGALWAAIPGALQAYRGSHIVITTIMFNFIASALMVHMLANVIIEPNAMSPETREFSPSVWLPTLDRLVALFGGKIPKSPLNISALLALLAALFVWLLVWRTRWGHELRTVGANPAAARYAGIDPKRTIVVAMALSGALAGLLGLNELQGVQHRITLNFPGGAGFAGIAVALMGRGHPAGILLAALLFGALTQGGAELAFEDQTISPDLVVVIQGIIILFTGALEGLFRPAAARTLARLLPRVKVDAAGPAGGAPV